MLINPYIFSSVFDPDSVSGLVAWYDADKESTLNGGVISNLDKVYSWNDRKETYDAAQVTGTAQPTYKTNILNGKPCVEFNGSSIWMDLGLEINFAQTACIFLVQQSLNLAITASFLKDNVGTRDFSIAQGSSLNRMVCDAGASVNINNGHDTDAILHRVEFNGASSVLRNRLITTGTYNFGTDNIIINEISYQYSNPQFRMHEILIYNTIPSSSDITNIENYLKNKWGAAI